jgi:hypothetical protein
MTNVLLLTEHKLAVCTADFGGSDVSPGGFELADGPVELMLLLTQQGTHSSNDVPLQVAAAGA